MSFYTDKQTLEDLNVIGKFKPNSIFSLFNKVKTAEGERLLETFFRNPLSDKDQINRRSATFRQYQEMKLTLSFTRKEFERASTYLNSPAQAGYLMSAAETWYKKGMASLTQNPAYGTLYEGLQTTIALLEHLKLLCTITTRDTDEVNIIRRTLSDPRLRNIKAGKQLTLAEVARYNYLLRGKMRGEMEALLDAVCRMDVFIAVSDVARERGFSYAKAMPYESDRLEITGLWHPAIRYPVPNSLTLDSGSNMLFLTGANMAGKSTFMKSFGIAVYLAHMGFPVAAMEMRFSTRSGMYTSINVPDNLQMGYSHFYAEVQRVKTVAKAVSEGQRLVVIFDELFKGTNVKDAFDATLAVASAFGAYRSCQFIISTHITEVGEVLKADESNIKFAYLPTVMEGSIPSYTYQMKCGITSDPHGMMIIQQEKVLELLG